MVLKEGRPFYAGYNVFRWQVANTLWLISLEAGAEHTYYLVELLIGKSPIVR